MTRRNTLRLTGGRFGGRSITVPQGVRPSSGRLREALFSAWARRLPGASLLDVFAGSGAVGLEALGRGCERVLFLEMDPRVLGVLSQNCRNLGHPGWEVRKCRLPDGLSALGAGMPGAFDLVFADPPYSFLDHLALLEGAAPLLATGGELALEHDHRYGEAPRAAGPLEQVRQRKYGESLLSFYRGPA